MANVKRTGWSGKPRSIWQWIGFAVVVVVVALGLTGYIMVRRAQPTLKKMVIETLSARFDSKVELDQFEVSLIKGLEVSGGGLRIFAPDDVVAAGATDPVITVGHFAFHTELRGLFIKPVHVGTVHVTGLKVSIPPREMRQQHAAPARTKIGKLDIFVVEMVCDDSQLVIGTAKPGKDPKEFALQHIVMRDIGPEDPWQYDATLVNAIPKGDIHATGTFGPWNTESPGDSPVTGKYTFDHADMNTIKGLGGMLSSTGEFRGQLNKIDVNGTADVPNFSLDTANHAVPLHTTFHAVVDGTSGDTYLDPVQARLGETDMTAKGLVDNVKGKGHIIDMDVVVPGGRLQDFLDLAVKTRPVIMTGGIGLKAKLHIPFGPESVSKKIQIKSDFSMQRIHFSNPEWQDKVDMLSLRAQGDPKQAKPGAEDVSSKMKGKFAMDDGRLNFSTLVYDLPGAEVRLTGVYSLNGEQFDFHGNVQTQAKLSQMVASKWKSFLLKAVDPFFTKDGKGTQVPIEVHGTKDAPKFGLDLKHKHGDDDGSGGKSGLVTVPKKDKEKETK